MNFIKTITVYVVLVTLPQWLNMQLVKEDERTHIDSCFFIVISCMYLNWLSMCTFGYYYSFAGGVKLMRFSHTDAHAHMRALTHTPALVFYSVVVCIVKMYFHRWISSLNVCHSEFHSLLSKLNFWLTKGCDVIMLH